MERRYKEPPIIEAVCELQFDPASNWDPVFPGFIYEALKADFPIRSTRQINKFSIRASPEEMAQDITTLTLSQFKDTDRHTLVQVGEHFISANYLAPYQGWTNFLPLIENCYNLYCSVTSPKGIQRIGVRYINRIDVPKEKFSLDLFSYRPILGKWEFSEIQKFVVSIEKPYKEQHGLMRIQLVNDPLPTEDKNSVILDIDYFLTEPNSVDLDEALAWVDQGHLCIIDAFENSITDQLRNMFQEIT